MESADKKAQPRDGSSKLDRVELAFILAAKGIRPNLELPKEIEDELSRLSSTLP